MTPQELQAEVESLEERLAICKNAIGRPPTHQTLYFERIRNTEILHDSPCLGAYTTRHKSIVVNGPYQRCPEQMPATEEWCQTIFSHDYPMEMDPDFIRLYLYNFTLTSRDRGATGNAIMAARLIIDECLPALEKVAIKSVRGTRISEFDAERMDMSLDFLFPKGYVRVRYGQDMGNHPWNYRADTFLTATMMGTKDGVREMDRHGFLEPWRHVPTYEKEDNDTTAEYLILSSDLVDVDWFNLLRTDKIIT